MPKPPKSLPKPANLDSFFQRTATSKRTAPDPTPSPRKIARTGQAAAAQTGTGAASKGDTGGGTLGAVETVILDDSDEDDCLVVEPDPLRSAAKGKGKLKEEHVDVKPVRPAPPVAAIFARRVPASPSTGSSTLGGGESAKLGINDDLKPDIKPSPTKPSPSKTISIFDTSAAVSNAQASSSSVLPSKPLDTPLFSFSPAVDVSFAPHARTPFSFFTAALVLISGTKSRLAIQLVLTNLLRTVIEKDPDSLLAVIYLCSNRIGPSYERETELGIGWQVFSKAIKETSGISPQKLKQLANKLGDPGDIAFEASKSVRLLVQPAPLLCHGVYSTLLQIAKLKGTGVVAQKTSLVKKLLLSAQGEQVRFAVRILASNLRIGAVRLTLLTALARAFCLSRPPGAAWAKSAYEVSESEREALQKVEAAAAGGAKGKGKARPLAQRSAPERAVEEKLKRAEALVRRVWARHPNFGDVVGALLAGGLGELEERVGLSVGIPLEPMLGSITRSLDDIYTRLGSRPFVAEAKLDGQRGQIHCFVPSSTSASARPPGVAEGAGRVFSAEDGTHVWVRVFSRHLEDMTDKYPDIGHTVLALVQRAAAVPDGEPLSSFVIDCEVVAIDPKSGAFKTFQELSYRSKKDVELGDIKVRVGIYCFDLMYLNGTSLLSTPFRARRDLLRTRFPPLAPSDARYAKWALIPSSLDNTREGVRAFFQEAVGMKAEGIMVKLLDEVEEEEEHVEGERVKEEDGDEELDADAEEEATASGSDSGSGAGAGAVREKKARTKSRRRALPATYEPDKRADSWLKCKKDYLEGDGAACDSLDLVPIAAWHGQGRKAGWWSPFLLACYDEETGAYTAVTKCLSGFNDAFYKAMREKYSPDAENPLTSTSAWPEVEAGSLRPDIWFKPGEVWEIRGADFTLSPVYPAARGALGGERGVSIRFPRFLRVREDKGIENATTAEQLAAMYEAQGAPAAGGAGEGAKVEEDEEEEV
ncbi:hypothetical protein JCM10450v2_002234 [Rhodotorula kratochvilovae]